MSEPKLISPMLDGFVIGAPISDHHGVRCCPAMTEDSSQRYIVKVISVPASQVQLDALLLTGAYPDEASALQYFSVMAEEIVKEADTLRDLAKLEGFVPYEQTQIVPMEDGVGYDVYLLSPYKRTLDRFFHKETVTHLSAVNLGLDMCAALAVARHAGYLYVDLKPENIFVTKDNEFRIGDLGFLKLSGLKYASLPDKYISAYTAPEIRDAMSAINRTVDIYAAGLILYQAYNGGNLPFTGRASAEQLPPPIFADYEMAEIILKACDPDPEQRWQDPIQMGQALISYMQRNGANNTPIAPAPVADLFAEEAVPAEETEDAAPATDAEAVAEQPIETDEQLQLDAFVLAQPEETAADVAVEHAIADTPEEVQLADTSEISEEVCDAPQTQEEPAAEEAVEADAEISAQEQDQAEQAENLEFLDSLASDETVPDEAAAEDADYNDISSDVSVMLSQADELIAHETPEPVVAPEPVEIPMPEPIEIPDEEELPPDTEPEAEPEDADISADEIEELLAEEAAEEEVPEEVQAEEEIREDLYADDSEEEEEEYAPFQTKKFFAVLLALVILAGLIFGGYYFYKEYYVQTVTSLTLNGTENQLQVRVESEIDEALLSVVCTDAYGDKRVSSVINGVATFSDLNPSTLYSVKVHISGLHKLEGDIADSYSTPVQTAISNMAAVTGSEEGSVIISFTASNTSAADGWVLDYAAEGEDVLTHAFTGNVATVTGLTLGKTYTFILSSESGRYLTGQTQITYTAIPSVIAEDLQVTTAEGGTIHVTWATPEGAQVGSWLVGCSTEGSEANTQTVTENTATFTGLDLTKAYTVAVTAEGMNASAYYYITANSVTVTDLEATTSDANSIALTWSCATADVGQWFVTYSVEGVSNQGVVRSNSCSAVISPIVPNATYIISVILESGNTVLGGTTRFTTPEADVFNGHVLGYIVKNDPMQFSMCKRPEAADWSHDQVTDYTNTFAAGENAAFVVHIPGQYNTPDNVITRMFVIRDESGAIVSCEHTSQIWRNMWYRRYCELDIPSIPTAPGNYTITVYFNGLLAHQQDFTVS